MRPLGQILAVVDPEMRPSAATRRAVELARRSGAQLYLCMPVFDRRIEESAELVDPDVSGLARENFIGQRRAWLTQWMAALADQGIRADGDVLWGPASHEAVMARVLELDPDLVVADLLREPFLKHWMTVKPSVWKLARLCPAPLMLVREDAPTIPARVSAAVDPFQAQVRTAGLDERVLDAALQHASTTDARLDLVHVFPFRPADEHLSTKLDELIDEQRETDRRLFTAFADGHSVRQERRFLMGGRTVVELIRYVRSHDVDLMVLGSEYRGSIERFFLGSTTESLVAQAPCDLLLVRPADFRAVLEKHRDCDAWRHRYGAVAASA
jgi:universal stress protein E